MKKYLLVIFILTIVVAPGDSLAENSANLVEDTKSSQEIISKENADEHLLQAVRDVDLKKIEAALKAGANPNYIRRENNFSTMEAFWMMGLHSHRHMDEKEREELFMKALNLLFDAEAEMKSRDTNPMFWAVSGGFPLIVELLISKGISPTRMIEGKTPVEWAETYGHQEVVKVLIKHGAEPVPKRQALQNRFVQLARESRKDSEHFFEQWNIVDMEKALEEGATVNGKNSKDRIALVEAIDGAYDIEEYITVVYLLQKGANPNLKSARHWSGFDGIALHHAVGFHGIMAKNGEDRTIYQRLIIEALLNAGAHVSSRGYNEMSPLHIAAKQDDMYAATTLIKAGAKIMPKDDTGKTPLDYAESAEMIKLLKSHGAKEL